MDGHAPYTPYIRAKVRTQTRTFGEYTLSTDLQNVEIDGGLVRTVGQAVCLLQHTVRVVEPATACRRQATGPVTRAPSDQNGLEYRRVASDVGLFSA